MDPYSISKLSAKYQFCAIHTADNTDGKVTGGGKNFTAGRKLSRHRYGQVSGLTATNFGLQEENINMSKLQGKTTN